MKLFRGLIPFQRARAVRDALAGVVLAAMDIPQVLGYSKIAGMPVVTGLYTLMLPLVAFSVFGSSPYLVVAADSATAAIFADGASGIATPASPVCSPGGDRGAAHGGDSSAGASAPARIYSGLSLPDSAGWLSCRGRVSGRTLRSQRDAGSAGGFTPAMVELWEVLRNYHVRICQQLRCRSRCWRLC